MTPFGERLRELRRAKGVSQKQMAASLGVSAAYLSALEHGRRGMPSWAMVQKIIGYFNIIWDDAEELQRLADTSDPRVVDRHGGAVADARPSSPTSCRDGIAQPRRGRDRSCSSNCGCERRARASGRSRKAPAAPAAFRSPASHSSFLPAVFAARPCLSRAGRSRPSARGPAPPDCRHCRASR